ncbi:hypothetical protein N7449_008499 [Penicillium cf. viridicatum]|uniref:DNA/RNA-binding domain-containing protein n=1 Tax=Penicillium cf. viridicatum TaxID=2972119 RepID=A0A9W9JA63_9EURO|nr:hypothetical protein N7449_008499 [Penicillium cf. viridicatum]
MLKLLAEKCVMPARMWQYGIHSFLELLCQKLPASLEFLLSFLYLTYSTMTVLLECVPAFKDIWIECLGSLAWYRMAVEADVPDRIIWAGVSQYWYNKVADSSPDVGQIQYHLAALSRPHLLQQFFYYTKALLSVHPFPDARKDMIILFKRLLNGQPSHQHPLITTFLAAHGVLFTRGPIERFVFLATEFLSLLQKHIGHLDRQGRQSAFITSCNISAVLEYGVAGSITSVFVKKPRANFADSYTSAMEEWRADQSCVEIFAADSTTDFAHPALRVLSQLSLLGASLASNTLCVFLDHLEHSVMYPTVHIFLAFILCLSLHPSAMRNLETRIPWAKLATFLNSLVHPDIDILKIESETFPLFFDGIPQRLSEDFLIRGQSWSQLYYPENFFEAAYIEDEWPSVEEPSSVMPRTHRCLWVGIRIAKVYCAP